MKQSNQISLIFSTIAMLVLVSCNDSGILKDTLPPSNNQISDSHAVELAKSTIDNRYIVMFKEQTPGIATSQAAQNTVGRIDSLFSVLSISSNKIIYRYKWATEGFAAYLTEEQVKKLQHDPHIGYIVKDFYLKLAGDISSNKTAVSTSGQITPWGISRLHGPIYNTANNTAWIIDTGIDLTHPDLNVDVSRSYSVFKNQTPDDQRGHGTFIAGIIAAKDNDKGVVGMAPGATVVAVDVCPPQNSCLASSVKAGVEYVAGHFQPGDVANISINYRYGDENPAPDDQKLQALESSIIEAADAGLKFTLSAGNGHDPAGNSSPARVDNVNVYTVSAYDRNDDFFYNSNYGNPPIDYGAPGKDITSLAIGGGIRTDFGGTSWAAPHIAGLLLVAPYDIRIDDYVNNDPDGNQDPIAVYGLDVSVGGSSELENGEIGNWQAYVSNGDGSYHYQWYYSKNANAVPINWIAAGNDSPSFSHAFSIPSSQLPQLAGIKVIVDDGDQEGSSDQFVYIQASGSCPPYEICS